MHAIIGRLVPAAVSEVATCTPLLSHRQQPQL
jgi:hypothetical protein